jgi:ABC-type nitrate/sulfonate/bicarbonate transport system substrate-binding protein
MSFHMIRRSVLIGALFAMIGASSPAPAADTLKIAAISRTFFYLPLWIAVRQGFMNEEGLDVQVVILDNSDQVNALLRNGEVVEIVVRSPEASIIDAYRGGNLRVIAGGISKLPHFLITQPRIKTLADLRGANFGVLAEKEGTTAIVKDIAKAAGLGPDDYKLSIVGGSPTRWRLLKEGKIDAGLQPIPNSYEAEDAGFSNLGAALNFVPDWQFTSVNVDRNWAEKNRSLVVKFLRGLQRGRDFMNTNRAETAKIGAEELRTTVAMTTRMLGDIEKYGMLDPQTALNIPGLRKVFDTLQAAGDIAADRRFELGVFADFSYWEQSHPGADPVVTGTIPAARPRR